MKLSVITINYNNAEGLQETIQSVIAQTYKELEYIVIDGGSTDSSKDVINQYADNISYWVSEKDKGVYNAQNKGVLKATGEYVLFLNSGDYFKDENVLTHLISKSQNEDIIYGDILFKYPNTDFKHVYPDELDFGFFVTDTLPHPCTLIKRELLVQYGLYNEKVVICADWVFFIDAVCKQSATYKHVDGVVSVFLTGGLSSNAERVGAEKNDYLNAAYKPFLKQYEKLVLLQNELNKKNYLRKAISKIATKVLPASTRNVK